MTTCPALQGRLAVTISSRTVQLAFAVLTVRSPAFPCSSLRAPCRKAIREAGYLAMGRPSSRMLPTRHRRASASCPRAYRRTSGRPPNDGGLEANKAEKETPAA
jgi:hypothetical protein